MAAAFDAKNTANTQTNSAVTLTNSNLTVGSGANRLLIATITFPTALPTITQFQWDKLGTPQNLTAVPLASSSGANSSCAVYALIAPTPGNKQLSVTWTGTSEATLSCLSFTGVDQTSVAVACPHGNGANSSSNSAAVTITSATNNQVAGVFITIASGIINSTNNNNVFIDNSGTSSDAAGNYANGAASVTLSAAISASGVWNAAGCDILAAASATLVASWYSPFEEPKRLKAVPAGFADLETNIATQAVPPKQFQPFFDRVGLIPRPAGFVDQQAALTTIAQPIKQFPLFDPPSVLKKIQPGFVDLEVTVAVVTPIRVFAPFDPLRLLARPPAGFIEQPAPLPAVSVPMQAAAFDGPIRLRQPPDWQQIPVPVAVPAVPPVFALSPSFDPPMRLLGLRVIETGFAYAPQIIVQPAVTLEIHNLPFHVTMGKLKSF